MEKKWFKLALTAVAVCSLTACNEDDDSTHTPPVIPPVNIETSGAYIINTGDWGANNGSIMWYNKADQSVSSDLYLQNNGKGIGDVQDICVYGSKLYVTCSNSAKIVILNLQGKEIKTDSLKNEAGQPVTPRYITSAEGKVFFTAYDGTVSRIDTTTLEIDKKITLGGMPEGLTYANHKLYVCQSDYNGNGEGKSISVIDVPSFTFTKSIDVMLNPYNQILTAKNGKVYFVSNGNYAGSPSLTEDQYVYQTLQCIDPNTDEVSTLCHASFITNYEDKIYVLYSEYYLPDTKEAFIYDLNTGEKTSFIDIKTFSSPQFIVADPENGDIYIGNNNYDGSYNDIYRFDKNGNKLNVLEAGYYTTNMRFVNK